MTFLRVIFAGSGEFGLPTLRAILQAGHELAVVLTQPDRPSGRGRKLTPTPVAKFATQHSLPLLPTDDINCESLPPADVMVVIAFGQKIAEHITHHPRLGSVNLHASRLPRYRGAAPINWAIINGENITGNSVIRLAQKMDAGEILAQSELAIAAHETAGELHDRLADDGAGLVIRVLHDLADGSAVETPQDESRATAAPKLRRESARLDLLRPADVLARQICGMYPWPGCRVRVIESQSRVHGALTLARARPAAGSGEPGQILSDFTIASGRGAVEILQCQPEGGRLMSLNEYRNGHPWHAGLRVESIA